MKAKFKMKTLKPYPSYKDSEVPWLGRVPTHWQIHRSWSLFTKLDRPVPEDAETVTCFRNGRVTHRRLVQIEGFKEAIQEHGYQEINKGDLVIHSMNAFAGAIGVSKASGKASPVYIVLSPRQNVFQYYYARLLRESYGKWRDLGGY